MEALAWRFEWMGQGPFSSDYINNRINQMIQKLGPAIDKFDTSFLNIYAQRISPPAMMKGTRHLFNNEWVIVDTRLKFGFDSKESFIDGFRIGDELFSTGINKCQEQFRRLLDLTDEASVKVYLVKPVAVSQNEIVFHSDKAVLIEEARTYQEFIKL